MRLILLCTTFCTVWRKFGVNGGGIATLETRINTGFLQSYLSKDFIVGKSNTSLIAAESVSSIVSLSMP